MPNYLMKKKDLDTFIRFLAKRSDVYAPVKDHAVDGGAIRFSKVSDAKAVALESNAYFPIKELFFRKNETLLTFSKKGLAVPETTAKPKTVFGIRRCDLHSLSNQDRVFKTEVPDPYYISERSNTLLIGYHCDKAEEYCFCGSLSLSGSPDMMFYDGKCVGAPTSFLVETMSENGLKAVKAQKALFKESLKMLAEAEKTIPGADRLTKKDITAFYDNPKWEEGVKLCLSCSACNHHCPSCYCFNICDEVNVHEMSEGKRVRSWAGCQQKSFTRVAGGHIFREPRKDRFRHRIYHQLKYFKDRYGTQLCSGCGRCIRFCPTRIDFIKLLNEM